MRHSALEVSIRLSLRYLVLYRIGRVVTNKKNSNIYITFISVFFGFTAFAAEVDVGKLKKNCASGEAGACGDLSISEYDAGKKDSAREHARAGCDNGNMRGCTMLGVLTKERGDKPAAMALFKKACDAQYMRGCLQLSVTEIETGNKDEAYRLAKKTCDGNEMQGCNYLAVLENTEGKKSEAMKHYKMACEGNVPAACHDLAFLISESESPNAAEIKKLYSSACDAGYINSCTNLGNIELKNENKTEATGLYKKACDGKEMGACNRLGILARERGDQIESVRFFTTACDGGITGACNDLGNIEEKQGKHEEAKQFYKKDCDAKGMIACNNLAIIESDQGHKDEAKRLFRIACDGGNKPACINLAGAEGKANPNTAAPNSESIPTFKLKPNKEKEMLEKEIANETINDDFHRYIGSKKKLVNEMELNGTPCEKIQPPGWTIVRKIDKNHYEGFEGAMHSNLHLILETTKTDFSSAGKLYGIEVMRRGFRQVPLENGFNGSVQIFLECSDDQIKRRELLRKIKTQEDEEVRAEVCKPGVSQYESNGCIRLCRISASEGFCGVRGTSGIE